MPNRHFQVGRYLFENDIKKLTYATVAIVTEHEPLIAITFVHFIVNVVAILSTGVPIFAPTWKNKKCHLLRVFQ